MSKATKRWQRTRDYVQTLPNVNAAQLSLFNNVCGEIELDEEEIGDALHVPKREVGKKDARLAMRGLELARIVEAILSKRIGLDRPSYKRIAAEVRTARKNDNLQALERALVQTINGFPSPASATDTRVYVEDRHQGHLDKMSVDLPLPGQLVARTDEHEKTWNKRLPNVVHVGPSIRMTAVGKWGYLPYDGNGNQDFIDFQSDGIRGVWTNDISYCVAVAFLFGSLPEYRAMTFTHLPGGDVTRVQWEWMFLTGLPGGKTFDFGLPSKVVVAYMPEHNDSSQLECLDRIRAKVPSQSVLVYGFTTGSNFGIDKFGYFGMLTNEPTARGRFSQFPNYFRHS
jgi:hypothetical protein